jgi:hypothetical protein
VKTLAGRHIYITNLKRVLGADVVPTFVQRCVDAHLDGVWIRLGRGLTKDPNLSLPTLGPLRQQLKSRGVELWGWHVPFCANETAAQKESAAILDAADQVDFDGIVVDAERTPESPRFRGDVREAEVFLTLLAAGLERKNRGFAFSSHDQPSLHRDLPFSIFLKQIGDVCPQVYYRSANPAPRLTKSVNDYRKLIPPDDFAARYKPTGNITMGDDVGFPNLGSCQRATRAFLEIVKRDGYSAHSFWCWDTAPKEVFDILAQVPV